MQALVPNRPSLFHPLLQYHHHAKRQVDNVKGIIMAGGEGSRLRPLTCDRPKPLVPVANKPVMEYAIELLRLYGIKDIGVTLQYLPDSIIDYFGDGSAWDVNLYYFVEDKPLGTAGSVKNAEDFLDETFVVVSGDALTDFNLAQAMDFHRSQGAVATLVLTTVPNPLEYGLVITNRDGRIVKFLEKPGWGEVFSDRVNTGIYVLEPEILSLIPERQMFDFSKDLFPELLRRKAPLYAVTLEGYWCDIGNLQQYVEAHRAVLAGTAKVVPPAVYQGNGLWIGKGVQIDERAVLEGPLLIGDYSRIGPGVRLGPYTVIGHNVQVKEGASVKRSVIWDGCYIGPGSELRGAVVGKGVVLESRVGVYEGAVVGDHSKLERGVVVKPEVKIWPHKRIGAGTIQYDSLVWGTGSRKNLFGSQGIPGPVNKDITPEVAAKLGAAYGSIINPNQKIGISCDGLKAAPMLKTAFLAGLLSTGVHGVDCGVLPFSLLRYAVDALGLAGGVHIMSDSRDSTKVWFRFVNEKGLLFSRQQERKLENAFAREDFRRVPPEAMGLTYPITHVAAMYSDYMLDQVDRQKIKERQFQLVVGAPVESALAGLLPNVLDRLGVKLAGFVAGSLAGDEAADRAVPEVLEKLAGEVVKNQADLGVWLDKEGEKLVLVDEKGQIVDAGLYLLFMASVIFQSNPGAAVAMPVTAPKAVECLAERFGGKVVWTKTNTAQLMETVAGEEFRRGQGEYPQLVLQFDAVGALLKLLDFLARGGQDLSSLVSPIPPYHMEVQHTPCPWEAKGQVMRRLIEEHRGQGVELLDGIKIHREQGWALILPDADEPLYRVYTESVSQEAAQELAAFYVDRIRQLVNTQPGGNVPSVSGS